MSEVETHWEALTAHVREAETLGRAAGLLAWDQQVNLPPKGAPGRAEQSALMSRLLHERLTDPRVGAWLTSLEAADLDPDRAAAVARLRREHDRATRVPARLVEALARAESAGFQAWMQARAADDFAAFAPALGEILGLVREKAAAIDEARHPYDVLLDEFDPGATAATLRQTFARLKAGLGELIDAVRGAEHPAPLDAPFPLDAQRALSRHVAGALGYDLEAGRIDAAEHPFSIGMGPGDVRITTHLYERDLLKGLAGTIHETGHAMYEQGLPARWAGTGLDRAASFGLHESQSRFWENAIGRSLPFFEWLQGPLREQLGAGLDPHALYRISNRIQPGLTRISADEVTYNLHIAVRFELELALFEGRLTVTELPAAWNAAYREALGVEVPGDKAGVLQDVHWSGGAFAYFPSYTLGNLYAASLLAGVSAALPDLWAQVRAGDFSEILAWLRANVHEHGSRHEAAEIVRRAVGERDAVEDLLTYLWGRHGALYGVSRP